jgi:high affinity sulfate transporter 1
MGYAQAAGLPPVSGLYATVLPLVAYAIVGPSPVFVIGPDSSLVPLIAATVAPLALGDPARGIALAAMLAVLAGVVCIVAGITHFGFLTELISVPVRYGYLNGIALTVIVGQLPALLGIRASGEQAWQVLADVLRELADDRLRPAALGLGVLTLVLVLVVRRWAPRWPAVLLGVAIPMTIVALTDIEDHGVALVGRVPRGLPLPKLPALASGDITPLVLGALGIALVSFADTSVLSRTFAAQSKRHVDPDRELVALGIANVATGLFSGFPVSASQSRTPLAAAAGARSQVAGIVAAAAMIAVLATAPGAFATLPRASLAGAVMAAAWTLIEIGSVATLARRRRSEFALSLVAFLAVVITGPLTGVGIAIAVSLLTFVAKAWRPHTTELVRVDGLKGYHDATRHPEGHHPPGLVLYRFDAPLFFANAEIFRREVLELAERTDTAAGAPTRWVVVTAEPITDIDSTAAAMLEDLLETLHERHVVLGFAELKGPVREQFTRYGLDRGEETPMFRTVGEAVRCYVEATDVRWTDWEQGS